MRTRSSGIFTVVLAGGLLLAACGGGSGSPSAAPPTSSGATTTVPGSAGSGDAATSAAAQAYRQCLKDNGVDLPAGGFGGGFGGRNGGTGPNGSAAPNDANGQAAPPTDNGGSRPTPSLPPGVDQATFQKALTACASLRPARAAGAGGAGGRLGNSAAMAPYRQCMQDNGVTLPSGPPSTVAGATATTTPTSRVDRNSDTYKTADAKCRVLLPTTPDANGSSSTTTPAQG